jgi:ectoine hydroxylase-related dioxygenase (phytanoyl-CoA dioxygenase family)
MEAAGFACLERMFTAAVGDRIKAAFSAWAAPRREPGSAGVRNLLWELPEVAEVAASRPVRDIIQPILGASAFPVRALWFDKTPATNWKVPWHQDLAIAVRERVSVAGFTGWSVKAGVLHVHPPVEILAGMVTVRLQLDAGGADNGPLRVLPGSHRAGKLGPDDLLRWRKQVPETECLIAQGGALVMRPLLLHASSAARQPGHRRVLHLEFAAAELPGGLRWAFRPTSA